MYHQRIFGFLLTSIREARKISVKSKPNQTLDHLITRIGVYIVDRLELDYFLRRTDADFNYAATSDDRHPKKLWYLFMDGSKYDAYMKHRESKYA